MALQRLRDDGLARVGVLNLVVHRAIGTEGDPGDIISTAPVSYSHHSLHRMLHSPVHIIVPRRARAPFPAQLLALNPNLPLPCRQRQQRRVHVVELDLREVEEVVARARLARHVGLPLVRARLARGLVGRAELVALARGVEVLGVEVLRAVGGELELVAVGDADVGEVAGAGVFEDT